VVPKRDKRQRSDLRAFVIALLLEGVSTPYELHSLAGLSPGATIPILQNLVEDGHVKAGRPGSRGRVVYVATRKGKKWLEGIWPSLLQAGPSGDLESDLRVFLIAERVGKDGKQAEAFLRSALACRRESLAQLQRKIGQEGSEAWLADQYVRLRSTAAVAMLKAELKTIDSILDGRRGGTRSAKRALAP
jgi:DNA-binding PadR family transcriptional regulator